MIVRAGLVRVACVLTLLDAGGLSAWAQSAKVPDATLNPLHALDKSALTGFRQRPLFNPSRAEPPPPDPVHPPVELPPSAPPPEPPPSLRLIGIVNGERNLAIVRRDDGTKTSTLATGDHLGAWIVTVVPPVGLTLRDGERVANYALFAPGPHPVIDPAASNPGSGPGKPLPASPAP